MTQWTYLLLMRSELHAEMRVFQVVNNQQVPTLAFYGRRTGNVLSITFVIETDDLKAKRIEALLYRLQSILRVDAFPTQEFEAKQPVERMETD